VIDYNTVLSERVDHDKEIRTIQLWNQLPADSLGTLSYKSSNFRKRVRKVINKAK
jgi:hypothetical protein